MFISKVSDVILGMSQAIEKYPSIYAGPLQRTQGDTGLGPLQQSAELYIDAIKRIQKLRPKPENIDPDFISMALGESAARMRDAYSDFLAWNGTFIQERYPAAQKELEVFMK